MFQRPPRGPKHNAPQYDPLAPNPFVPPNLPTYPAPAMPAVPKPAVPATRMPQTAASPRGTPAANLPVPKKMNTQTNREFDGVMQRNAAGAGAQQIPPMPGDPPKNIDETYDEYNKRVMRHRMGTPLGPARSTVKRSASPSSPSNAMQPSQPDYFGDAAIEGSLAQLEDNSRSGILRTAPLQPSFRDRTGTAPLLTPGLMPDAPTASPVAPGVNEELLSRLPGRSERDRSSMQPGGMVDGGTFDAMAAREREERLAPQRALAQREDVTSVDNRGFTRTVDRTPESPTYGQAKVEGSPMFGPSVPSVVQSFVTGNAASALPGRDKIEPPGNLWSKEGRPYRRMLNESREPRRKARLAGEVYTDPETGAVSDYGRFNEAREARQERKDAARELRTRRAQLMNYGRTGGVTVAPGGGIAGPMTVGTQATFGPNMSLNQATRMAQGQLDQEQRQVAQEERASDALRRVDQQQAIQNRLQAAQAMQDGPEKDAVLQSINNDILQPSDGSVPKPSTKAPSPDKALAQSQAEAKQLKEIEDDPQAFYENTVPGLRGHLSGSPEDDAYLDNYFDVQGGGSVATPEQIRDNILERSQGIGAELRFLGDLLAQGAAGFAGGTAMGPLGQYYGTFAGAYKAYIEMQAQQKKYQRELEGINGYIERRDAKRNATSN